MDGSTKQDAADGEGDGGTVDEAADGDADQALSPEALHQMWHGEVALVKRLKQQGVGDSHPAMRAACSARDAAEHRWRSAKDPTPAPVRLARAHAKLDRAVCLQAESRAAIVELERAFKEQRAALQTKLDEDTARVRERRRQLDDVQEELATVGRAGRHRAEQCAAVKQVHGTLCNEIAPTIASLVEQLDSATPAWSMLNGLLATLSSSKVLLEKAIPARSAQAYNIGDGPGGQDADGGRDGDGSEWSESHELEATRDGVDDGGSDVGGAMDDHDMDTDDWWGGSHAQWQSAARWERCGHEKWERASWADCWENEHGRDTGEGDAPPAARRRLDDGSRASADAGGRAAASATAGGPADADQRARLHRERVDLIIHRAIDAGIQPLTAGGEDLHVLDPNALDAWAAEHFPEFAQGRN